MGPPRTGREGLNLQTPVADDDRLAGRHRLDALRGETQVHQGHALAGRGKQRALDRIAQGLDAQRVAGDDHVSQGIEKDQAVRPVKLGADLPHGIDQRRLLVGRQGMADLVHEDLGIGLPREMVIVVGQKLGPQLGVIRQLAVERETEPLVLLDVGALEGLGIVAIIQPAGGIADMADRGPAVKFLHQALVLSPMVHAKNLANRADILIGADKLFAMGVIGRHAGRQLAAVLDVQQHPRHEAGHGLRPTIHAQGTHAPPRQVIDCGHTTFVA